MFRLGGLVVDLDDWQASLRIRYLVNVACCEHEADHEGELHDAVQRDCCNQAVRDSCPGSFDFVACKFISTR